MSSFVSQRKFVFEAEESREKETTTLKSLVPYASDSESSTECQSVEIIVNEDLDPNFSCYTWPCAAVMAQFLWFNRERLIGKSLLEISSGTSLPGILAAKLGASVTLSEFARNERALQRCLENACLNETSVKVAKLIWGQVTCDLLLLKNLDFIIMSDVFYDSDHFEDIIFTISFLLGQNPKAECYCAYQVRDGNWNIASLLAKWNLCCVEMNLRDFQASEANLGRSCLPGSVQIDFYKFFVKGATRD